MRRSGAPHIRTRRPKEGREQQRRLGLLSHSPTQHLTRITASPSLRSLARSLALVISGSGAFHVIVDRQTLSQTERGTHGGERALQTRREDEIENRGTDE